mmetsp:Transcript_21883/g.28846  ORF Transcript_21883/g.28846 Transcript_21883/m.28846 type:complete len:206 (-) Transcript_21883:1162-1779(-)
MILQERLLGCSIGIANGKQGVKTFKRIKLNRPLPPERTKVTVPGRHRNGLFSHRLVRARMDLAHGKRRIGTFKNVKKNRSFLPEILLTQGAQLRIVNGLKILLFHLVFQVLESARVDLARGKRRIGSFRRTKVGHSFPPEIAMLHGITHQMVTAPKRHQNGPVSQRWVLAQVIHQLELARTIFHGIKQQMVTVLKRNQNGLVTHG